MNRSEQGLQRRVAGIHDIRLDGISDIVPRVKDAAVLDLGCNRGVVSLELAHNGARLIHGVDNYVEGIGVATHIFADIVTCRSRFIVADLTQGPKVFAPFGGVEYDVTLCLATYHKLKRIMPPSELKTLMTHIGRITRGWFAWRGTREDHDENEEEMVTLDRDMGEAGLARVHTSYLSRQLGVAAIWARR